jgi:hypothetical protein
MTTSFISNSDGWPVIDKDPGSVLDYTVDWTDWLADVSDTISTSSVTASGITKDSSNNTTAKVTAWLSGGTAGQMPSATYRIVTTGGRTDERTIYFNIKER